MFIKRYWYIILLLVVTLGLGVVTYLTSTQLAKKTPVAPNVPQVKPQAVSQACTISFTMTSGPSNTPTSTPPNQPSKTPTATPSNTPTSTITPTPSPTPFTLIGCYSDCDKNNPCQSGLVCLNGLCRKESCPDQSNCNCLVSTSTPTMTPTSTPLTNSTPTSTPLTNSTPTPTPTGSSLTPIPPTAIPTPETPVSGNNFVTVLSIVAAGLLLLLGLVF
jgi:hypothetical protein